MDAKEILLAVVIVISILLLYVSGHITGAFVRADWPKYGVRQPSDGIALVACCDDCNYQDTCYTTNVNDNMVLKLPPCMDWEQRCRV